MTTPTDSLLADFQRDGFAVLPALYSQATIDSWHAKYAQLQADGMAGGQGEKPMPTWWFGDTVELAPRQFLPVVANPVVLDFLERVIGPFVQVDNVTLAGFPSGEASRKGAVSGWHRDRYACVPYAGAYVRPTAINVITYGQDLTDEMGPLRVIPGSHLRPIHIPPEARNQPHKEERVLPLRSGDTAILHNSTLHSGTANVSGKTRLFFSIFYNHSTMRHTDSHAGPATQRIVREARARGDRRTMRLFGVDELREARANSGFMDPDEKRWADWAAEDRAAIKPGG